MAHESKWRAIKPRLLHGSVAASNQATTSEKPAAIWNRVKAWRVVAAFITAPRKTKEVKDEQFSFYLKKKPEVLLRDLSSFMSDSVDLPSLFHETADVLNTVTKASWVSLYLVDRTTNEVYLSTRQSIKIKERYQARWNINEVNMVATYVARKKIYVMVEDLLMDVRFPDGIGYNASTIPKSVLCIPVMTPDGECFACIELVRDIKRQAFSINDLKICVMVTAWMGVAIHQNQERLALKRQQELNDYLLELIKCYFEDNVLMEKLMAEVVKFAKSALGAERGSFFIIDKDSDEMVAHLFDEDEDIEGAKSKKVRVSKERGIAGLVARTGKTVNIKDAYKDTRFNKEIDQKTGFITRSILCMPISGAAGVLGVVQVVNKRHGGCFTSADENLFKTFSIYCSLAVHYTDVHSQINKQKRLNTINLTRVKLQQVPCKHESDYFRDNLNITIPEDFDSWYVLNSDELTVAPQYIFHILTQLIDINEINVDELMTFILVVRRFYRDVPFHNFEHAFNVCHCMYGILLRNEGKFSKLEVKSLLIATICHDLDHGGYTNNFLQLVKHDLAVLYHKSTLENHHTHMALTILGDYTVFKDFDVETTRQFYDEIRKAILATDLSVFFENKGAVCKILKNESLNWANGSHRDYCKAIMMNSCDLSGNCKPFLVAKRITDCLYREFYRQGDLEKEMGVFPLSLFDRDKVDVVPEDQIQFLNVIVIPCVDTLAKLLPTVSDLLQGAILLRTTWRDIIDMRGKKFWRQDDSIVKDYLD